MSYFDSETICVKCQHKRVCQRRASCEKFQACLYFLPFPECNCLASPFQSKTKKLTLRELMKKVVEMDSKDGYLQSNFAIEECAELIIEMARTYRDGRTTDDKIFDEACDVLATTFVLLYSLGVTEDDVRNRIKAKYHKALENEETSR